jgi:hypothetical protein
MGDMPSMDAYTEDTVAATMTARDSAMAWDLKNGGSDLTRALVFFSPACGRSQYQLWDVFLYFLPCKVFV